VIYQLIKGNKAVFKKAGFRVNPAEASLLTKVLSKGLG
jgi:hypothetical protein